MLGQCPLNSRPQRQQTQHTRQWPGPRARWQPSQPRVTRIRSTSSSSNNNSGSSSSNGELLDVFAEQDPNSIFAGCGMRVAAADYDLLLRKQDKFVSFKIPCAGPGADMADFLKCPTVRHMLKEAPHKAANRVVPDLRFVDDGDRVALRVMSFASPNSTGAKTTWWGAEGANGNGSNNGDSSSSKQSGGAVKGGVASLPRVRVALPTFGIRAGPRQKIYWDPAEVTAAIVTTGSICPGINNAIQSLVMRLSAYGVQDGNILGVRYGVRGFLQKDCKPVVLTPRNTDGIHLNGGSHLGTSVLGRNMLDGESDEFRAVAKKLKTWGINMLFVIGGEGGMRMVTELSEWCVKEKVPCSVIGLPKSIENDMLLVDNCFGFQTVVQEAERPLLAAKTEASSARSGIGLVKLMGRRAGFIPMQASLSSGVVDVCLIPEVPFQLEGPHGLLAFLKQVIEVQGHAVVAVAEGAGQDLLYPGGEQVPLDERGNPLLRDIGTFLKKKIKAAIPDADIKYIDPTYMIQATACNSLDHIFTRTMAYHAVDAAFAGYTGTAVAQVQSHFSLLPAPLLTLSARRVDPDGKMWNRLRAALAQPHFQEPPTAPDGTTTGPVDPFATLRTSNKTWSVLSSAAGIAGITANAGSSLGESKSILMGQRASLVEQVAAKEASLKQRKGGSVAAAPGKGAPASMPPKK